MQKVLKDLSQDIAVLDVDTLLQKLTKKIRDVLKVDVSDVRLIVNGEWCSLGVSGTEPGALQPTSSAAGRGLSRSVVQSGRPVAISDIMAANASTAQKTTRHGFRGYAGVPLLSRNGEAIGVLRVLTYWPRHFHQHEIESQSGRPKRSTRRDLRHNGSECEHRAKDDAPRVPRLC